MTISTFNRYEIKYLLDMDKAGKLIERLKPHMSLDGHCPEGQDYQIHSIYFDTRDSYLIRHSMSHPFYKQKLRLRSYKLPVSKEDQVFLEIKKKMDGIISKRRAVMSLKEAEDFVGTGKKPQALDYINAQVIDEIAFFMKQNELFPAAYISYRRLAFCGIEDKGLRLTFDTDIIARRSDVNFESRKSGDRLLEDGQVLMEIKLSSSVPVWLADALSELNIYRSGYSKYGEEYGRTCLYSRPDEIRRILVPAFAMLGNRRETMQRQILRRGRSL